MTQEIKIVVQRINTEAVYWTPEKMLLQVYYSDPELYDNLCLHTVVLPGASLIKVNKKEMEGRTVQGS